MNKLSLCSALIISCAACTSHSSCYSEFADIESGEWPYGRTLTFAIDTLSQPTADKKLYVSLRHDNSYEFSNAWLEIKYPTADSTATDTLNIQLADIYGRWAGKGVGVSYQLQTPPLERFEYRPGAEIKIHHIMRADTLRGIQQIGITIQP